MGGNQMGFFDLNFWQDFVSNTVATLIGAGLGVLGALWLSNLRDKKTEHEKTVKVINLLWVEILQNKNYLSKWYYPCQEGQPDDASTFDISISVQDEVWRSFSDGGELQWINDLDLLNSFANTYHDIGAIKQLSRRFYELVTKRGFGARGAEIASVMEALRERTKKFLDSVAEMNHVNRSMNNTG